jgi:S-adenosylmethionine:tRNA ribosyltransferase-isomerase
MQKTDLEYVLPETLIAQQPQATRRESRLLVVDRARQCWEDHTFEALPRFLGSDDVVVMNNTRVVPARFTLRRPTGGRLEGLWLEDLDVGVWRALLRNASAVRSGEHLQFEGADFVAEVIEKGDRGAHVLRTTVEVAKILQQVGEVPLPPYIKRPAGQSPDDLSRYQTVYAAENGAIAAPTAGLHFDDAMLDTLQRQGILLVDVTLHVGQGTFSPIVAQTLQDHDMHSESYKMHPDAARIVADARTAGRRVAAVGTTSVRVLETVAAGGPLQGQTSIFIYPPYEFLSVDMLLTNFHLPGSTLLALVYAFGGVDLMRQVYAHAVASKYRFFSYGDAMLIV